MVVPYIFLTHILLLFHILIEKYEKFGKYLSRCFWQRALPSNYS